MQGVRGIKRTRLSIIVNSRTLTQWYLNSNLILATWAMEVLCRSLAFCLAQTPLLEQFLRQWCQTPRRWTCLTDTNVSCLHGDKEGVLHLLLDKVARECRPEGQGWQILRQVSPTQSHQSSGAAEKATSTVRGLARTYLAVFKTKIPSFGLTPDTPMLPWTVRHALTRYNVRKDTRMAP